MSHYDNTSDSPVTQRRMIDGYHVTLTHERDAASLSIFHGKINTGTSLRIENVGIGDLDDPEVIDWVQGIIAAIWR